MTIFSSASLYRLRISPLGTLFEELLFDLLATLPLDASASFLLARDLNVRIKAKKVAHTPTTDATTFTIRISSDETMIERWLGAFCGLRGCLTMNSFIYNFSVNISLDTNTHRPRLRLGYVSN